MSWAKKKPVKKSDDKGKVSDKTGIENVRPNTAVTREDKWSVIQMCILNHAPSMIPLVYLPVVDVFGRARVLCNGEKIYISEGFWRQPAEDCLFMILQEFAHVLLGHRLPNDVQISDNNINPRIAKLEIDMMLIKVQNMLCNSILLHSPESIGIDGKIIRPSTGMLTKVYQSFGGYNISHSNEFTYYMNSEEEIRSFTRKWSTMSVGLIHEQLTTGYKICKANSKTKTYTDIHFSVGASSSSYASKYIHMQYTPKGEFLIDIPAELVERLDNQVSQNELGDLSGQQQDQQPNSIDSDGSDNSYGESYPSDNTIEEPLEYDADEEYSDSYTDDYDGDYEGDDYDDCDNYDDGYVNMTPTEFGEGGGGADYSESSVRSARINNSLSQNNQPTVHQMSQDQISKLLTSMSEEDLLKLYNALGTSISMDSISDLLNQALDPDSDIEADVREMLMKYMEENNIISSSEEFDNYDDAMEDFASLLNREQSEMSENIYKDIVLDSKRFIEESSVSYNDMNPSYGNRIKTTYNNLYKVSTVWWKKAQSMIMGYVPDVNSSFKRPNKRYVMLGYILPSRCEKAEDSEVDRLRVFLDSSASMSDEDFFIFKSIIRSSQSYFPQETKAYEFNTTIMPMKCVRGKIVGEPKGTGGTNITCVTRFINEQPDKMKTLNIVVTDGGFNWSKLTQYMKKEDTISKFIFILTRNCSSYKEATKTISARRLKVLLIDNSKGSDLLKWR